MAKRFTDTDKWNNGWFCSLTTPEKLFWTYITDICNVAGIWQVNWPLVKFRIPEFTYNQDSFKDRIQVLSEDKWLIKKFVPFQYGRVKEDSPIHRRISLELEKEGVSIGYQVGINTHKDMEKDMEKEKGRSLRKGPTDFERFWKAYPKKVGKGAAEKAWAKIPKEITCDRIVTAIEAQKKSEQWQKDRGQFIPHPSTWLNQKRWEDEIQVPNDRPALTPEQRQAAEARYNALVSREIQKVEQKIIKTKVA